MARKTAKDNLYRKNVDILSQHMTLGPKKPVSLDDNVKHLRSILSVDTIIDDINQEEALEFLEAIEGGIAAEREEHKDELSDVKDGLIDGSDSKALLKALHDVSVDRDQCKELLDIITEDESDLIYDYVKGKGYVYVKIDSMVNEQKLRDFIEKEIYSRYTDQVENIMF